MVSKNKYYELKSKGLCVKCGASREGSPSEVRCLDCHQRSLHTKKDLKAQRGSAGLCVQCGIVELVGNSKYCNGCREKNAAYKKKLTNKPISVYKENNENCRLCNGAIDTIGLVCQKCLDLVQFSRLDALNRYGNQCGNCSETDLEKLVIASSDIAVPMKHSGPELYKFICFSTAPPKTYIALCSACYWQINMLYIRGIRDSLLMNKVEISDEIIATANSVESTEDSDEDLDVSFDEEVDNEEEEDDDGINEVV